MDRPQANLIVVGDGSNPTPGLRGLRGALLMFPSDVKARDDKMVGLVETVRATANSFRLPAYSLRPLSDAAPETRQSRWP